ncbi:MAG: hypothetical protein ACFFG0_40030 [Candidatus Thorarchaeota archaeon]
MKKKIKFLEILFLTSILFSFISEFTMGFSDIDEDGIDDNFEALNKRDIDIIIAANEITVESTRITEKQKDLVMANVVYNTNGISFQIGYKSNLEEDFALLFNISFNELIEFVDMDMDGIYNPEIDQNIQNFSLSDFSLVLYENSTYPSGSVLHHIRLQTENETVTIDMYYAEEFILLENSLLLPTQTKIDIRIANFTYLNSSSQIALYSSLHSETFFVGQQDTEDEKNSYAENEEGVITTVEGYNGFLTWKSNITVDDISKRIQISEIMSDIYNENSQKIYFNYPRGALIEHNYKIGVEGLLIYEKESLLPIIVLALIIGALSVVAIYSVYHTIFKEKPSKIRRREGEAEYLTLFEEDEYDTLFDSKLALQILEGEDAIDKLYHKGDINLTAVSVDFYEIVNQFGFEEYEKRDFINEMLSLTPQERELILREMRTKTQ